MSENKLNKETSPYLLQHKNNPVNWYPWCKEAFENAQKDDKPIFLSIGYSSCHWCHVMAHESFDDKETADFLNENFINIKVDREERPDIDEIYMEAVQLMTKHGGWPLSVFLTPDLKPFYGGTYFPLEAQYGQPSFKDVLSAIAKFYDENKKDINERSSKILEYLKETAQSTSLVMLEKKLNDKSLTTEKMIENLQNTYNRLIDLLELDSDKINGGFGRAPKFPQPAKLSALLFSKNKANVAHAIFTLNKIRCGGIIDQIGGGIARYSVDTQWLVPHFEKMLYDNAQIISLFSAAHCILKNENPVLASELKETAQNIYSYLERDLKNNSCALYFSAEDADSEGEEGLFYTFFHEDFSEVFNNNFELKEFALNYFNISLNGNFDGTNILTIPEDISIFCKKNNISLNEFNIYKKQAREILFKEREKRIRPELDTKCLLSWNSLAVTGLLQSSLYLNNADMFKSALDKLVNILSIFKVSNEYKHVYNGISANINAFSDDLGYLLEACTETLLVTGSDSLLKEILNIVKEIHKNFIDPIEGILYYSAKQEDHVNRPTKPEDNVIHSAHSAIFGSISKIIAWLGATGKYESLSQSEHKMLESLALISLSNTVSLSENVPIACAQMLQKVKWFEHKNVVILNESNSKLATLKHFNKIYSHIFSTDSKYFVIGNQHNDKYNIDNLTNYCNEIFAQNIEISYSYCNKNGCQLPTDNLSELAVI
ncbi:thioredoxin domain-containing protein [Fluviispira sanaruensis]|uniref:Thioredoxin domain-containing protein n=1 Tax=Fluviispira sanaruensis TaxID=2493639 RepID=A0A4P2VQA1_FLUSA|nr:thioredoxin domain-containing protein [Fluviispira sanaruensis]BBH54550.1 thioredoxin domain-containing protein [Fluviispira sanaruensis]